MVLIWMHLHEKRCDIFMKGGGETFFHNKAKNKRRESNSEFVDNSLFRVGRREPVFSAINRDDLFWRRAHARTSALETLYGGQFTLLTQLAIPNYPAILSHRRSTTVSLETYPLQFITSDRQIWKTKKREPDLLFAGMIAANWSRPSILTKSCRNFSLYYQQQSFIGPPSSQGTNTGSKNRY